jgi:hypothetical protein
MHRKRHYLLILFALVALLVSCSPVLESSRLTALSNDYCAPGIPYAQDTFTERNYEIDTLIARKLSLHDYTLAAHIGLIPLLSQYLNSATPVEKIRAKQRITDRILLLNTEIEAVVAELDCNGERYDQLGRFLSEKNSKRNTRLTVASIVAAAAVTLSTALIKNDGLNKGINIGGGITGTALGFMLLNPKGKKLKLPIYRSLLNNVWYEKNDDKAFPPALWLIITDKTFSNEGKLSLIQTLKKRWLLYVFDGKINQKDEQLYFGTGGYFSEEDIEHLSDMHNELQASVRTVAQDMRSLISAVDSWE